jgi:hypothetical protein
MPFQWLEIRIGEEQDRRQREAATLAVLPEAVSDLNRQLKECVSAYTEAFGKESADISFFAGTIRVTTREHHNGKWETTGKVEIVGVDALPGFKVENGSGDPMLIEVGLLPGDKLFFRREEQFLNVEDVTRRILDRLLFPKLRD